MIKFWHISDLHLSFDKNYKVLKPMDQRSWSKGSDNYVNYLNKISDMGLNKINNSDFVVITGDITHDMTHKNAIYNMNWIRKNINGTIILSGGNHDRNINFGKLRMELSTSKMFFLDEGELLTVGPYTFGCYSNHKTKSNLDSNGKEDPRYIDMAQRIVAQSARNGTTPVMVSHYPMNANQAAIIGSLGVKAYLSGHIHCTKGSNPTGNDFEWYDSTAKPTDNKTFGSCFFSTGTTDVLVQRNNGKIFKEIECLTQSVMGQKQTHSFKSKAAQAFGCNSKFVSKFDKADPFNRGNNVTGFICRKKGKMQGSLYITHVNGVQTEPQLIYGTPKLEYPYKSTSSREWIDFSKDNKYYLANKWNGMNVLFYKYFDAHGSMYISAKSKGTAFLSDTDCGDFLTLTKEVLNLSGSSIMDNIDVKLMELLDDDIQSISFELCGQKEKHLVKYDFDIDLKPLFTQDYDGNISIATQIEKCVVEINPTDSVSVADICKEYQDAWLKQNKQFRGAAGLDLRYEFERFCTEGGVLYALNENGTTIERTLYKVKPRDIEEVHWASFDTNMQNLVQIAIRKIKDNNEEIDAKTLQEELDMGPKEWSRFGKPVMEYTKILQDCNAKDSREVIVLVGLPGSGKSTLAAGIEGDEYIRINQDTLGSRNKCKGAMVEALRKNKKVVIDRVNFDINQRKSWIDLAYKLGVTNIKCIFINTPEDICKERVCSRTDHPTVPQGPKAAQVVDKFNIYPPSGEEGFTEITEIDGSESSINNLIDKIKSV